MMEIFCVGCGGAYPPNGLPYQCPMCGGLYDLRTPLSYSPIHVDLSQIGIWRYRHTFGISLDSPPISLGEGNTPLIWVKIFDHMVAFKCEYLNPSGSFKDRGSTVIAAWLDSRGIKEAVEDSSGNAGASFAAYAARAGIKAQIFTPSSASGPKRRQVIAYGAELIAVDGTRSEVTEVAKSIAVGGKVYASHAYLPFNIAGYATTAYEIFEQLGNKLPGTIVLPVGQGGMLLGLVRGFEALRIAYNMSNRFPRIIGVQTSACAPLGEKFSNKRYIRDMMIENHTLAEGVGVSSPVRGDAVLKATAESNGDICVVDEDEILPGRDALARLGFFIEPTSAIVWSTLKQIIQESPSPVVVILTGSGYKYE